jgi:hypothetical protein
MRKKIEVQNESLSGAGPQYVFQYANY